MHLAQSLIRGLLLKVQQLVSSLHFASPGLPACNKYTNRPDKHQAGESPTQKQATKQTKKRMAGLLPGTESVEIGAQICS
jgi:hypothetical protein